MPDLISIGADSALAIVAVDRPPANVLDPQLLEECRDAVRELDRLDPAAVVVQGPPGFSSAGLDLCRDRPDCAVRVDFGGAAYSSPGRHDRSDWSL
jgi:enoyl-CoA hydratase/carnithine racemase